MVLLIAYIYLWIGFIFATQIQKDSIPFESRLEWLTCVMLSPIFYPFAQLTLYLFNSVDD